MTRECHVRFCEGPRVKLPRSTHPYIRTGTGWLYLAIVLDLYSRKVVGWAMAPSMPAELVCRALQMAIPQRQPAPGLIVHSDRGSQGRFNRSSQH